MIYSFDNESIDDIANRILETENIFLNMNQGPLSTDVKIQELIEINDDFILVLNEVEERFNELIVENYEELYENIEFKLMMNSEGIICIIYN
jgi:hypothetical protein